MPLLNGEQFVKQQPPPNLDPNEEVFFSPITYEVFRDYDEFFERTILLNSLTWSCSFCGKRQLTYTEAQACEQADENQLATFGVGLSRGLLHIMLHSRRRRLSELVDLLVSFSVSRFFVGEKLNVKRPDNSLEHFVVVERVILPPQPGQSKNNSEDTESEGSSVSEVSGMPDPKSIKYVVRSASPTDESTGSTLILPSSALQRPARNYINRDRIKFFIRQTGQLESQIFVPRESLLRHFNLYPKGSLRWADIFADPELRWFDLTPPRTASGRDKVVHSKGLLKGAPRSGKTSENSCGLTKSVGGSANQQSSESTWDAQRLTRIERMELERTWSLLRKRDDLDLSDLVPLPSFTPLRLRLIPLEDFGTCLQVYEFYHVFGGLLRLPVPGFASQATDGAAASPSASSIGQPCLMSDEETGERSARLTWDVLEEVLLSTDPMGPLADVLLGLLGAIRRLENETNGRQLPPTAEAAAASTVSAIATLEAGLPLAYAGILTGLGSSQEYSTMLTESLLCDHALALIFRGAADTTRQAELVGVPPAHPALTSRAERAALALGGQAAAAASVGGGAPDAPTPNRSAAVRACALACAVGAASLPPLDRAGLADALWLHITTAPAKAGGWRGGIWGGTRPLDDPCVELIRRHKDLVDKLRVDPIYSWSLRERLTLITTLMDELLMQPQLRERMDEGFERVRQLRLQLRGIQAERYKLYGGNANIANMLYGFSPSTLISSCDNWLTGTPPILRNNMNRPRKKTIEAAKAKIAAEYSNAKGSATDSDSQKAGSEAEGETSAPPPPPPINTFSKELEVEEQELWASVLKTARRFSMIPLGQDRVYRRYWLVMSLPAILIEDTLQELSSTRATSMTPAKKTEGTSVQPLRVRGRQVCASATLGSSPAQAARTIQQAIDTLLTNSLEDEQWQNPRLLDRDSLISQLSIDLPHNREALPMEQLKNLVHPARRSNPLVDADHPAVTQVEKLQRNPPRWSVLLPLSHSSSSPSPSDDSHDESTRDSLALDRYRGARLAIDQLEASLNPRGTRESHLRKSVCQLRPILIKVVADCPTELLVASESLKPPVGKEPDSVLLSWLEATARGVAMRLGVPLSTPNAAADSEENVAPNCEEAKQSSKFQELVQMILSIGNAIGPRRLAAPLSADDRSLRGSLPSTASLSCLDSLDDSNNPPSPCSRLSSSNADLKSLENGFAATTTGFQRWCACVQSATTTSQLHLLVRALERAARRANRGGRGVPAAIGSYATRFRLPETRCTACRGSPDTAAPNTTHPSPPLTPFSLCGGCACPFHVDCLLNSLSRQSTSRSLRNRLRTPQEFSSLAQTFAVYSLLPCQITTTASARQDALRSATLLCDRCRRLSGCDVKEKFADPLPNELLEAVEMKAELVEQMEESLREELDEEMSVSSKNTNLTPLLDGQRPPFDEASTLNGEQESDANSDTQFHPVGRRRRHGRPRRSSPYLTTPSSSPPRRSRPPKRPRYLDDYEADTSPSMVASPAVGEEGDDDGTWKPPAPASLEQLSVISTDDVLYEDEVEAFVDLKTKAKTRGRPNGSYGGGKEPSTALIGRYSQPPRRSRPLRPDIQPQATRTLPADETVDAAHHLVDTPVAASGPGPIQSQQAAERLLAEISALSVARPLLRCALSKTVQAEAPNKPSEHHQHAHRTRRSVEVNKPSTSLYAYDLESLKDLLTQGALPGGPREIVPQLRLLTMHWMACNRPGSRLHGCAQDVSAFLEKRLSELSGEKVGTASVASVPNH